MNPKIKNAILFIIIAVAMILAYVFFIKKDPEEANLVSSFDETNTENNNLPVTGAESQADPQIAKDFLAVLLSVKNISLDDSIFTDVAFTSLRDSSILLTPDGTEGRPNPFAPIGADLSSSAINSTISNSSLPVSAESVPVSPLNETSSDGNTNSINTGSKPAN